jgi:uncharacterized membrane protein YqhA
LGHIFIKKDAFLEKYTNILYEKQDLIFFEVLTSFNIDATPYKSLLFSLTNVHLYAFVKELGKCWNKVHKKLEVDKYEPLKTKIIEDEIINFLSFFLKSDNSRNEKAFFLIELIHFFFVCIK